MTDDPPAATDHPDESATRRGHETDIADTADAADSEHAEPRPPRYAPPPQEEFDWRGWVLVGIVMLSFLVIPSAVLYLPYAQGVVSSLGLSLRQAYLALPMIPALLLGATAIWAAVRSRTAE